MGLLSIDELMNHNDVSSFAKDLSLKIYSMDKKAVFSYDDQVTATVIPRYLYRNKEIVKYFMSKDIAWRAFKSMNPLELKYN
ncbi:MAG TPA: hypothetical protein VEC16_04430 [Alphaproteobacteria bacterium]|nr:hypothetical protein [Alphaproteobacteria bacterium]